MSRVLCNFSRIILSELQWPSVSYNIRLERWDQVLGNSGVNRQETSVMHL